MARLGICTVVAVAALLGSVNVGAQSTPDRIAQAMVKALKDTPGGLGQLPALLITLESEEEAAFKGADRKALDVAMATTGESLSGLPMFQAAIDVRGWFMSRRPLTADVVGKYVSRYGKVDKATVEKWRTVQAKSGPIGNSPTLTLSAIVFQDFLWDAGEWKKGNPERALARLGSLSTDAVSRWGTIAKSNGSEVYGAWTLLAVDALFVNESFQQALFDTALPLTAKLLVSR